MEGADAIGLVFYPPSPRAVEPEQARRILEVLPPFVTAVALFVNAEPEQVRAVLERVPVDLLQFHGEESPEYCASFGRRWIKALAMKPEVDVAALARSYRGSSGILLDTWQPDVPGGTGRTFQWDRIPPGINQPLILAGGLRPENVAEAVERVRPWGVDVSSGVEQAKGVKDPVRVREFIRAATD